MKAILYPLLAILLGAMAAFHTFSLLFNTSIAQVFPQILAPIGLAATASFALSWLSPGRWIVMTFLVALPTMLMAAVLFIVLWTEGRADWSWPLIAIAALGVCYSTGWLALRMAHRRIHI